MRAVIGIGEIKELLKSEKAVKMIIAAGAALILLIAFGGIFTGGGKRSETPVSSAQRISEQERGLEERLAAILSEIDGVGEVRVMVTLDTSEQMQYGRNSDMLLSVTAPEVRGVIVVCEGGGRADVRERVVNAVTGVFGINSLRVSVSK